MSIDARPSGRFLLRIDPGLHGALRGAAEGSGVSLNEYCARKLASPGVLPAPETIELVEAASRVAGESLAGVVAFGSWARGEAGPDSDVDLLIVLDSDAELTRSLYRKWDELLLSWHEREVEPHFVHLPPPERSVLGVWAEVAIDGIVLFEQGLVVSRRLSIVRREIAEGRIVRRSVHGQPYWVEAA